MCHSSKMKVHQFGLIDGKKQFEFKEGFACVGDAVNEARGNDAYLGVVTRVLLTNGQIFKEDLLIKKSRDEEFLRLCGRHNIKRSIMNF